MLCGISCFVQWGGTQYVLRSSITVSIVSCLDFELEVLAYVVQIHFIERNFCIKWINVLFKQVCCLLKKEFHNFFWKLRTPWQQATVKDSKLKLDSWNVAKLISI